MKTIPLLSIVFVSPTFFSCKKSEPVNNPTNFGFAVNNNYHEWNFKNDSSADKPGAFIMKEVSLITIQTMFVLYGTNNAKGTRIRCCMYTDSLMEETYRRKSIMSNPWIESTCYVDAIQCGTITDDFIEVTITGIKENDASGYFSATMHEVNGQNLEANITNGYFNNVLIYN